MSRTVYQVKGIFRFGPRKVANTGRFGAIYLPKSLAFLRGKIVQVTIEVLDYDKQ